jgi:spore coat protein CotH
MRKILAKFKSVRFVVFSFVLLVVSSTALLTSFSLGVIATRDLGDRGLMIKLLPVIRSIRGLTNVVYLPYYFKKSNLPVYQLEIRPEDLAFLNQNLPPAYSDGIHLTEEYRQYVPAKFIAGGKEYSVEARYRGDTSAHWSAEKKSWLIKFKKGDLFKGMRRIHLILPFDRGYIIEHFNNYRAKKLGLITPQSDFAVLYVNGKNNGVYFEIEGWDRELVAKNQQPDETNVYGLADNDWVFNQASNRFGQLGFWEKEIKNPNSDIDSFAEFELMLDLLNNALDEEFFAKIPDLLDMEKFYKWQIHSLLVNSKHQMVHDLRFYFNNATGKFELIPWDVEQEFLVPQIDENYNPLIERIFRDPEFVHQRNKILWEYVKDDQNLEDDLEFYDQTYQKVRTAYYQDPIKVKSNLQFDLEVQERRQRYIDNYHYIQKAFRDTLVFVNVRIKETDNVLAVLELETANFGAVSFQDLDLELAELFSQNSFRLYYDSNNNRVFDSGDGLISRLDYNSDSRKFSSSPFEILMHSQREIKTGQLAIKIKPKQYRFFVVPTRNNPDLELDKVGLVLVNSLTNQKIKPVIRYIDQQTFDYFGQISQSFEEFHQQYPYFVRDVNRANQINLLAGEYYINKTIIIPKGFILKVSPGTVLRFAPGVSLISYSPVIAQGTENNPIRFIGQSTSEPWGVFGVVGPHPERSVFEYCLVEGGSEAYINGIIFTGQLAIHWADVRVNHCQFKFAKGDDGLNVKKGKIEIQNSYFYKNKFDGLDLDWTSGKLANNYFLDNGQKEDLNGDGLDISGTEDLIIYNNQIKNSPDKCLSIGESTKKSTIIFNNLLAGCQMGVAVKDNSRVQLINNTIVDNKVGISVYEKKPVFGGAWPVVLNTIIWYNEKSIELDAKSGIDISYSDIEGGYQGEQNLAKEPIFQNKQEGDYLLDKNKNPLLIKGSNEDVVNSLLKRKLENIPIGIIEY